MGDAVLLGVLRLPEGRAERRIEEDRVVAEAARAARFGGDASLAAGAEQAGRGPGPGCPGLEIRGVARARESRDGDVARAAPVVGDSFELLEENPAATRVVEIGSTIPGRQRTGAAAERVHLEARVVRQGRNSGERRVVLRFAPRVLLVGAGRLLVGLANAEVGEADGRDAERRQKARQLARLAGVEGGDQEPGSGGAHGRGRRAGRTSRRVFRWCSNSRLAPWLASSSNAFISSGVNGVFSPVPCTST